MQIRKEEEGRSRLPVVSHVANEKCPHDDYQESLHIELLLKTEQENSPFYVFNHFTVALNGSKTI